MQSDESGIWNPDRNLTKDALSRRARTCLTFFENCVRERPEHKWARKGLWYATRFQHHLSTSPTDAPRCRRLAQTAQRRFRCSHPNALATLGKDLIKWLDVQATHPDQPT